MRRHPYITLIAALSLIFISLLLSWIIISGKTGLIYSYTEESLSGVNKYLLTIIILSIIGASALLITESLVFTLLLATPLLIDTFNTLGKIVFISYTTFPLFTYIGTLLATIGLLRFFSKKIQEPLIYAIKNAAVQPINITASIGASMLSYGIIGILAGKIMSLIYGTIYLWLIITVLTSFITGVLSNNKKESILLGFLSPFSPAISITPVFKVSKLADKELTVETGIRIGNVISKLIIEYSSKDPGRNTIRELRWKTSKTREEPLRINPWSYRNPHIMIIGESGSGKSYLAKTIAIEKRRKKEPVIILDIHGEYTDLQEYGYKIYDPLSTEINPLDLDGESPSTRILEYSYMLTELFNLGQIQRALLIDVLREAYRLKGIYDEETTTWSKKAPSLYDVLSLINERILVTERRDEITRLDSLRKYLEILLIQKEAGKGIIEIEKLASSNTVISINKIPNPILQQIMTSVLLRKLFVYKQKNREKKLTIILDEAHRFMTNKKTRELIERVVMEARKFGISLVLITQNPVTLTPSIISNIATRIIFRLTENKSLDYITRTISPVQSNSIIEALKTIIKTLPVHQAVLATEYINILILFKTIQYNNTSG